MANAIINGTSGEKVGNIEYKMAEFMAKEYLKEKKIKDGVNTIRGQEYLCKVVNEEFGVKGNCVRVITF